MVTSSKRRPPAAERVDRAAVLEWVPISQMRVSEMGQRKHNQARVDYLTAHLDLEQLGYPTVNWRDGLAYIIDGQHRVKALVQYGLGDSYIECWTYHGLSRQDEAARFLTLNNSLIVGSFDKFRIAVEAGHPTEAAVATIVAEENLKITRQATAGGIRATDTLTRIYDRDGADTLRRTLAINREAFGGGELGALMLDAVGLIVGRYPNLDDAHLVRKLLRFSGGVPLLLGRAETLRQRTGQRKTQCLAAEIVTLYNSGSRHPVQGRLTPWWKSEAEAGRQDSRATA